MVMVHIGAVEGHVSKEAPTQAASSSCAFASTRRTRERRRSVGNCKACFGGTVWPAVASGTATRRRPWDVAGETPGLPPP
eukprot:scaffold1222_cov317-Pavlova_lutheri.AAC.13